MQVPPAFLKFELHHFVFLKDLPQYLLLLTKRNMKGVFPFRGKKSQGEQLQVLSVWHRLSLCGSSGPLSRDRGPRPPSSGPGSYSQPSSGAGHPGFTPRVLERVRFILIEFVRPIARQGLR